VTRGVAIFLMGLGFVLSRASVLASFALIFVSNLMAYGTPLMLASVWGRGILPALACLCASVAIFMFGTRLWSRATWRDVHVADFAFAGLAGLTASAFVAGGVTLVFIAMLVASQDTATSIASFLAQTWPYYLIILISAVVGVAGARRLLRTCC
jgi:uncharacterized integral membrane protein